MPSSKTAQEFACSSVQCLAGSIHSIRSGAGRNKEPETHLQTGWLWRDEENSRAEQQWTNPHLYGWMSSIHKFLNCIKVILFNPMALLLLTGISHVLPHHWGNDKNQERSCSTLFAQCHFSTLIENTDTLFSWIPHHYHPRMLHKQLIVSLPTTPWEKQKPAPCIGSSGVVSKPSLGRGGCFAELTQPPAWPGTETDKKGGKAPGQWSGHEFFLLLWEERVAFIYSCSIQVSQSLSCRKLAWEVTRVAWFSLWCFLLWHFICFNAVVSPIIGSIQCISQAEHLENEKHLDGSSFSTRGQHED